MVRRSFLFVVPFAASLKYYGAHRNTQLEINIWQAQVRLREVEDVKQALVDGPSGDLAVPFIITGILGHRIDMKEERLGVSTY